VRLPAQKGAEWKGQTWGCLGGFLSSFLLLLPLRAEEVRAHCALNSAPSREAASSEMPKETQQKETGQKKGVCSTLRQPLQTQWERRGRGPGPRLRPMGETGAVGAPPSRRAPPSPSHGTSFIGGVVQRTLQLTQHKVTLLGLRQHLSYCNTETGPELLTGHGNNGTKPKSTLGRLPSSFHPCPKAWSPSRQSLGEGRVSVPPQHPETRRTPSGTAGCPLQGASLLRGLHRWVADVSRSTEWAKNGIQHEMRRTRTHGPH